jgi:hypothetical protein
MRISLLALISGLAFPQTSVFDMGDVHVSKPSTMRAGGMIPEVGGWNLASRHPANP